MAVHKRLMKELKTYSADPVVGTGAKPREDNGLVWDCVVRVALPPKACTDTQTHCDVPLVVLYGMQYPSKSPDVGFPIYIPYRTGAICQISANNALRGYWEICLDLLGNFAGYHAEWQGEKGTGWSPAYNICSLLVNLQSVLQDSVNGARTSELTQLCNSCKEYLQSHPDFPKVNVITPTEEREREDVSMEPDSHQHPAAAAAAGLPPDSQQKGEAEGDTGGGDHMMQTEPAGSGDPQVPLDESISCWYTGDSYTEAVLGYGIQVKLEGKKKCMTTDGNLISLGAFESGLRQYPDKQTFVAFLPGWVNKQHAEENAQWREALETSLIALHKLIMTDDEIRLEERFGPKKLTPTESCLRVLPEFINTLVVLMSKLTEDVRASQSLFQTILSVWRCLLYAKSFYPEVGQAIIRAVQEFSKSPDKRRKHHTPDIGIVLVKSMVLLPKDELDWPEFYKALAEESNLRRVLWWQRNKVSLTPESTYEASAIGRRNMLFQSVFRHMIVGTGMETEMGSDGLATILAEVEKTNCLLPDRLDALLKSWKGVMARECVGGWNGYFEELVRCGLPRLVALKWSNIQPWLDDCVRQANLLEAEGYCWVDYKAKKSAVSGGGAHFRGGGGQLSSSHVVPAERGGANGFHQGGNGGGEVGTATITGRERGGPAGTTENPEDTEGGDMQSPILILVGMGTGGDMEEGEGTGRRMITIGTATSLREEATGGIEVTE
eukprot:Cvel_33653.t1-p1 / transcript=Cvel_33653.t1 / gene=Cvel_33653 / organism=Chromera_velia_CCMP2878 / gene_product=Ubiquitin-conjugating enzyme E2 2, putative / transcript_product=Ubiquitin-conjugating enzyme E2 2, putative / location=Cvel_scaffold5525:2605-5090(+) / protein_length=720 / sequence_SO=supercontig / SO=protein_coding / is_pseudo=false